MSSNKEQNNLLKKQQYVMLFMGCFLGRSAVQILTLALLLTHSYTYDNYKCIVDTIHVLHVLIRDVLYMYLIIHAYSVCFPSLVK